MKKSIKLSLSTLFLNIAIIAMAVGIITDYPKIMPLALYLFEYIAYFMIIGVVVTVISNDIDALFDTRSSMWKWAVSLSVCGDFAILLALLFSGDVITAVGFTFYVYLSFKDFKDL